ncbi:protein of unknown function DUF1622 [Deinococcus geothermalis DSM 11300]|uniref:DUF1622 domain-containing protein n=1 Tax=Deinococcus geothermalis (strain DSM 11300 / CIP 105573 / AG-3a) TaxID=319795 RepID=Q1IZ37_DEIGD|nr:DUF1622 domain-containing protein [Deinococcus geothermalis]ABF45497.1 protein of unknown function DUF1622 [Deinococcus geothermalis DSM 11300]
MEGGMAGFFEQFEAMVGLITRYLATGVEGASGIIVGIAVLEAVWRSLVLFFVQHERPESLKEAIRLRLGRWLSVVLEFLLAADILRTAVAPNWNDIGKLAAIAAIRTALNYFLGQEVREETERIADTKITAPIRREQG